jgi:HEAT repeat protein
MGLFGLTKITPSMIDKMLEKRDVKGLIKALGYKKDNNVVERAAEALGKIGEPAVDALVAALKDNNTSVRRDAASALGKMKDARAVEPLITALADSDPNVRRDVAEALGMIGDARAVEPLIAAFEDSDDQVRNYATEALVKFGDARTIEPLIDALEGHNDQVRKYAAQALGEIGDARAVKPLIAALNDSSVFICMSAGEALSKIGEPAVELLIANLRSGRRANTFAASALVRIGKPTVEPLIVALKNADQGMRENATETLGRIGDTRAAGPLIEALKDKNSNLFLVCEALAKIGDARAVEPLIDRLNQEIEKYTNWHSDYLPFSFIDSVAESLKNIGGLDAEQALIKLDQWEQKEKGQQGKEKELKMQNELKEERERLERVSHAQKEIELLTAELIEIGKSDDFLSMEPGGKFNENCRNIRACQIGERLNKIGGLKLMQVVGYRVANYFGPGSSLGPHLNAAWNRIGNWIA